MLNTLQFIWSHPISSSNRSAALSRYLRWQIGTRLLRAPVVMPFVGNTRLVCERSMTGATGNLYCGLHEFGDMGFLLHFLRSSDVFLDVGANIGSFTILASGVVGAKSLALEPVPSTFEALRRNISVNGLEGLVEPLCVAAGARFGTVRFSIDRDTMNQVVDSSYSGVVADISMSPLDDVSGDNFPTLLKVDVEGFERDVLEGASNTLRSETLNAVLLEGDSAPISELMHRAGFVRASYAPVSRRLEVISTRRQGRTEETLNNLWIRDVQFVEQRCQTAGQFTVYGTAF